MRAHRVDRDVRRREARTAHGLHPHGARFHPAQVQGAAHLAELLKLPENTEDLAEIQKADGTFYFSPGFSRVGGTDPIKG